MRMSCPPASDHRPEPGPWAGSDLQNHRPGVSCGGQRARVSGRTEELDPCGAAEHMGARLTRGSGRASGAAEHRSFPEPFEPPQACRATARAPGLRWTASPGRFLARVPCRQRAVETTQDPYRKLRCSPPRPPGGTKAARTTSEGAVDRGSRTKHRSPCKEAGGAVSSARGGREDLRRCVPGKQHGTLPCLPRSPRHLRFLRTRGPRSSWAPVTGGGSTLVPDSQSSGCPSPAPLGPWEVGFAADTEGSLPRPTSPGAEGSAPFGHRARDTSVCELPSLSPKSPAGARVDILCPEL